MERRKMWSVGGTERVDERLVCELTPNGGVPVPLWKVRRNLIVRRVMRVGTTTMVASAGRREN